MTDLISWGAHDWSQPQPWATIPCPCCEEAELAKAFNADPTDFVCMNCGEQTKIEAR
jgi:hypothetical protein